MEWQEKRIKISGGIGMVTDKKRGVTEEGERKN